MITKLARVGVDVVALCEFKLKEERNMLKMKRLIAEDVIYHRSMRI